MCRGREAPGRSTTFNGKSGMRFDGMGPNFMIAEKRIGNGGEARHGDKSETRLAKFGEERLHFGAGVRVAFFLSGGHARRENAASFLAASEADEELAELLVGGDVVGARFDQFAEVLFGSGGVARVHTIDGETVAREDVVGFCGDKFFEALAARLLLGRLGHGSEAGIIAARVTSAKTSERG